MGHLCQIYEETLPVASVEGIETLIDPMDIEINMIIYSATNSMYWQNVIHVPVLKIEDSKKILCCSTFVIPGNTVEELYSKSFVKIKWV